MARRWTATLGLLALLFTAACARPAARSATPPPGPDVAGLPAGVDLAVERVIDGDTIVVTGRRHVRLIGIDTALI